MGKSLKIQKMWKNGFGILQIILRFCGITRGQIIYEEPKIKATLSNEKGQYLVIEKKNYGWSFLKMKENHYYKLGVTYKKDVDRTIEMEKSLGLIPQD